DSSNTPKNFPLRQANACQRPLFPAPASLAAIPAGVKPDARRPGEQACCLNDGEKATILRRATGVGGRVRSPGHNFRPCLSADKIKGLSFL
ncbi:MAG: hypothetical protein LBV49_13250, partial [Azonexus sp.]|nr:hypothetical protein [Azonexus sp.]